MADIPDLLSVVLVVKYRGDENPDRKLPSWWGRSLQALYLELINKEEPEMAQRIHDSPSGPPPFTTSTLIGFNSQEGLKGDKAYRIRLTALNCDTAQILSASLTENGLLAEGKEFQLDYLPFQVQEILAVDAEHPWSGQTTYQDLSAAWLSAEKNPSRYLNFSLTSPTLFKSKGKYQPFPTPGLVVHSLLLQWNTYAPITFPDEVKRFAEKCLLIERFKLSSRGINLAPKMFRLGSVGKISFKADHYDRYWLSVLQILGSYALYAGVGKSTALGLGQARLVR